MTTAATTTAATTTATTTTAVAATTVMAMPVGSSRRAKAGARRRSVADHRPAWLAALGALAILAATLGFAFSPVGEDNAATTDDAAILRPDLRTDNPSTATSTDPAETPATSLSPTVSPSASPSVDPALAALSGASPAPQTAPPATATRAPAVPAPPAGGGGGRVPGGMSGIAAGSLSQVRAWEAFRGSAANVIVTFTDRSSWQNITHPWLGSGPEKFAGFAGTWVISQPFYPTGGGDMASCAAGAYSAQWREFGSWLVSQGRAASIIRLAWEFNGDWFPWSVKSNPTAWVSCFRQVVSAIRATDPQARIDWAMNAHSPNAFENYPGDAYVDIIGIDTYDQWPASRDDASWNTQCHQATGLCSVITFARQHGKQFSVPEWGLVATTDTGAGRAGQAGGDNPFYIQKMYETFQANADVLAYEAYFNDNAPGNVHSSLQNPTTHPSGAARYASLW